MTTDHVSTTALAGPGRRDPEPAGRPDRCARSNRSFGVAPIETTYPRPGWAEQQPLAWWSAAGDAVRLALAHDDVDPGRIAGIGLDCTACTVVACDSGRPAPPPGLALDGSARLPRGRRDQCHGRPGLALRLGPRLARVDAPQGLWLKRNEPEVYQRAERIVECTDWMMFQLTGEWTLSLNHVAVKWNYARPDGGWPRRALEERSGWMTSSRSGPRGLSRWARAMRA